MTLDLIFLDIVNPRIFTGPFKVHDHCERLPIWFFLLVAVSAFQFPFTLSNYPLALWPVRLCKATLFFINPRIPPALSLFVSLVSYWSNVLLCSVPNASWGNSLFLKDDPFCTVCTPRANGEIRQCLLEHDTDHENYQILQTYIRTHCRLQCLLTLPSSLKSTWDRRHRKESLS